MKFLNTAIIDSHELVSTLIIIIIIFKSQLITFWPL